MNYYTLPKINNKETKQAIIVSKKIENETKKKRKIRKLGKKLLLDPATEAME